MEVELCHLGVEANKMYTPEKHVQICGQEHNSTSRHMVQIANMSLTMDLCSMQCVTWKCVHLKVGTTLLTMHVSSMWRLCNLETSEWHVNFL